MRQFKLAVYHLDRPAPTRPLNAETLSRFQRRPRGRLAGVLGGTLPRDSRRPHTGAAGVGATTGPPGSGKTLLAGHVAAQASVEGVGTVASEHARSIPLAVIERVELCPRGHRKSAFAALLQGRAGPASRCEKTKNDANHRKPTKSYLTDIPQMPSKFVEIVPPFHRQGNGIPSAAIRWPDFGDRSSFGRPFAQIFRHSDTPLLSFSHRRRFPRPTPERVFAVDHRSGSGFFGTVPSARQPRPVGT